MFNVKKLALTTLVAAGLISAGTSSITSAYDPSEQVQTVAHRGASGYAPENTMAAFRKGVEMKADYIEIDVQMSKDGELVVIHDTTLDRTTDGSGNVKDHTLEDLRRLDAGSFYSPEFAGEKIPTFEEVIDEFRGNGILIELKAPHLYPGIEKKVAAVLKKRDMDKPANNKIIIQSFDFNSLKITNELLPDMPIGALTGNKDDLTAAKLKEFSAYCEYVNPYLGNVTSEVVDSSHSYDMGIMSWTVRKQEEVQPLLNAGVDGIITDYPDYVPQHKQ
ncbi:glycerophosphodiester phosphodiesterase [Fictibacillus aquaticus]|uniref:Glycerophosphodiester phosphodiesterase n=1 Tax=Fictibacillus aquaticus TaxID=2021314 RepID=A0A235F7K0_9BACL|nr:glycerophosphodiester phosphodiesterase family protein [Fictibacillus aquaticus]OYD57331.1 glycerophosphodiester phosphodiesterase [Fictibacillus aquaticus]